MTVGAQSTLVPLREVALGVHLRPYAVHALGGLAVCRLAREIREERGRSSSDLFAAGTVVTGVRRAMASLVPAELRHELPSDW